MWISKKKYKELVKRIADLEQNQSQQSLKCTTIPTSKVNVRGKAFASTIVV